MLRNPGTAAVADPAEELGGRGAGARQDHGPERFAVDPEAVAVAFDPGDRGPRAQLDTPSRELLDQATGELGRSRLGA